MAEKDKFVTKVDLKKELKNFGNQLADHITDQVADRVMKETKELVETEVGGLAVVVNTAFEKHEEKESERYSNLITELNSQFNSIHKRMDWYQSENDFKQKGMTDTIKDHSLTLYDHEERLTKIEKRSKRWA